jgi:hypothetical protein
MDLINHKDISQNKEDPSGRKIKEWIGKRGRVKSSKSYGSIHDGSSPSLTP